MQETIRHKLPDTAVASLDLPFASFLFMRQNGERQHVCAAGSLEPSCGFAARRLRSPSIPGGSPLKARYARASDGQGYFQHNSATERSHIDLLKHVHFFYKNSHLFRIFPTA